MDYSRAITLLSACLYLLSVQEEKCFALNILEESVFYDGEEQNGIFRTVYQVHVE